MNLSAQFTSYSPIQLALLVAFITVAGIQVYYYLSYFFPLSKHQSTSKSSLSEGVSVLIAAKNEESTIENCVLQLLKQVYPHFEIIVVNDYSEDGTLAVLKNLNSDKLIVIDNTLQAGKKSALSQGIARAQYEWLLFTDADCLPDSNHWISNMVRHFSPEKEIVLGFGAFKKNQGILNKLIRFEGFMTAMQYFGFAKAGKAYMGVGRNLAYKKSVFQLNGGFSDHQRVLSGDDDLLVNKAANSSNVGIEMDAHTISEGELSWKRFVLQKRRQLSAGVHYKKKDQLRLAIFGATSFLFYGLFVILLIFTPNTLLILGIFVLKQVLEFLLFKNLAKRLRVDDLLPFISFLEPLYIFSLTAIGVSTRFWKVKQWK